MQQNRETTQYSGNSDALEDALLFENVYDDGTSLWFTEYHYNALFRMEKKNWIAKLVGVFPEEELQQERQYASTAMYNGKMYFAPFTAKEIAAYDLEKKRFRKIPIKMPCKDKGRPWECAKFFRCVSIGEKIYFIPFDYPGILCYDTVTGHMDCFDGWVDEVEKIRASELGYFVEYEITGSRLILPCACADAIVIFDIVTHAACMIRTADTAYACKYCGICREGDYFYLLSGDGTLSKRKLNLEEVERVRLPAAGTNDMMEFYPMRSANGVLSLFPFNRNRLYRIDAGMERMVWEKVRGSETMCGDCEFSFPGGIAGDGVVYVSSKRNKRFIIYNPVTGERSERKLFLSANDRAVLEMHEKDAFIRRICQEYVVENEEDSFPFLLRALRDSDKAENRGASGSETKIGEKIYHALISE